MQPLFSLCSHYALCHRYGSRDTWMHVSTYIYVTLHILNTDGMSAYMLIGFLVFLFYSYAKILFVSWT